MTKYLYYPLQEKLCQREVGVEGAEPHRVVSLEVAEHCVLQEMKQKRIEARVDFYVMISVAPLPAVAGGGDAVAAVPFFTF